MTLPTYEFSPTPEFIDEVFGNRQRNFTASVLEQYCTVPPINEIETTLSCVSKEHANHGRMVMSSFLGLHYDIEYVDPASVAEIFKLEASSGQTHATCKLIAKNSGLGGLIISDRRHGDLQTIITSHHSGDAWAVDTGLGNVMHDDRGDYRNAEAFVWQHAFALNTLASALVSTVDYQHGHSASRMFRFAFPDELQDRRVEERPRELYVDPFDAFAGMDGVVDRLREVVLYANADNSLLEESGVNRPQSVLLWGPSGGGKSELMNALAEALEADTKYVNGSDVSGGHVGEWAKNLDQIFENAFNASATKRIIIIMDEFDGLILSGNPGVTANINAVLKRRLEELRNYPNVFFAAATNHVDLIDNAVKADKRMHVKVPVLPLGEEGRAQLFARLLGIDEAPQALATVDIHDDSVDVVGAFKRIENQVARFNMLELARLTVDFSAGDIVEVLNKVRLMRLTAKLRGRPEPELDQSLVEQAIQTKRLT